MCVSVVKDGPFFMQGVETLSATFLKGEKMGCNTFFSGNTDNLLISKRSGQIGGRRAAVFLSEQHFSLFSFIRKHGEQELG